MAVKRKYRVVWRDPHPRRTMPNTRLFQSKRKAMRFAGEKASDPRHKPVRLEQLMSFGPDRWEINRSVTVHGRTP